MVLKERIYVEYNELGKLVFIFNLNQYDKFEM